MKKLIFIVGILTQLAFSQSASPGKGVISGIVLNSQTQEALIGANILVLGTTSGAISNERGEFTIRSLATGTYSIRVTLLGYEQAIVTDIVVNGIKPANVTVNLLETKIEFEGVEVTAGYFRKSPETPLSTQQQSGEEIRRLPGGLEDVVRAISILPGVAQVQAGRNDLVVRGGAPSENLFLIDNLEVPNINHFGTQGASGGPLSYVNLDFVEATSFSTGGFGARYGDKLSSVLSIKLKEGRTDRLGGKLTLAATQFGANIESPIDNNGSFIFSARRSYLDLIFKAAGFGFVPEYWDFLAKGSYRLSDNDRLSYIGIVALDKVKLFNDTEEKRFDNSRIMASDQNQYLNGVTWKHIFSSGYSTVTLSHRYNTYGNRQNDSLLQPVFLSESDEVETSLLADAVLQISQHSELSFGIQGKLNGITNSITLPQFWTNYGENISLSSSAETTGVKTALFAQWSQTMGHLQVHAGARGDYFSLLNNAWVFAPRFSATYALTPSTNINGSMGIYYQAPSAIWLASNPLNGALNHLKVNQFVLGFDHILSSDVKFSIEGYLKEYSRYPVSLIRPYLAMANTGAGFGGSEDGYASFGIDPLASLGTGKANGIEVFLQKKLSSIPCYGTVSISFNESRFTALDGVERPGSFDQRWILNIGGGYVFDNEWEASAKFRFVSGRPYTPYRADGTQDPLLYNSERVGSNHSLDVRVDRRWAFDAWALIVYLDIQNIYNRKTSDVPRYNERLGRTEESDAIGILPSIGVSAEF